VNITLKLNSEINHFNLYWLQVSTYILVKKTQFNLINNEKPNKCKKMTVFFMQKPSILTQINYDNVIIVWFNLQGGTK